MARDYQLYLDTIVKATRKIEGYVYDTSFHDFSRDSMCRDAVLRNLRVISASVARIPPPVRAQYPEVAWHSIEDVRGTAEAEQAGVNWELIWTTVQSTLPTLHHMLATALLHQRRHSSWAD